ncbi:hypothetical protein Gohar_010430 [Gossypium harknessii]|uniref:DUF668 domain-containing protein n=1 Tax=Gossypium harknessii TaxID=34285 RepID=A0A7J9GQX5_9ROSI|nr:hypothetical protein [Gossypium harknessii]
MALETWLIKLKKTISNTLDTARSSNHKANVGVLSFEIAGLMSKLLQLWNCLSDKTIIRLRDESLSLEGVHKIVSNDESFLLGLACAEMAENIRVVAKSISRISKRCQDSDLQGFDGWFDEFANSGHDRHGWVLSSKDMEAKRKKMDKYVTITATLYKEMEELSTIENCLRKCKEYKPSSIKEQKIVDLQTKLFWQRQEVKYLKRDVYGTKALTCLSASATVHPTQNPDTFHFVSGPLKTSSKPAVSFFESNSKLLKPPSSTLGAAALALHYANLIIIMEKMIKSPQLVGVDARDDLYSMLPSSIRSSLRGRLKGIGLSSASDPVLAGEWRTAVRSILGWLSPLAHNMIKWQSERSFEHQNLFPKTNVILLFQTLFFANKEKTEAAITELLVGLNYIWRFEREMTAKALFHCTNFNGL